MHLCEFWCRYNIMKSMYIYCIVYCTYIPQCTAIFPISQSRQIEFLPPPYYKLFCGIFKILFLRQRRTRVGGGGEGGFLRTLKESLGLVLFAWQQNCCSNFCNKCFFPPPTHALVIDRLDLMEQPSQSRLLSKEHCTYKFMKIRSVLFKKCLFFYI